MYVCMVSQHRKYPSTPPRIGVILRPASPKSRISSTANTLKLSDSQTTRTIRLSDSKLVPGHPARVSTLWLYAYVQQIHAVFWLYVYIPYIHMGLLFCSYMHRYIDTYIDTYMHTYIQGLYLDANAYHTIHMGTQWYRFMHT